MRCTLVSHREDLEIFRFGAKPDHKPQGTCEARCTVAEPSGATGILIANSPIMTRLLVADGGVALNYVLTSDSVSKQVNLAIIF